MVEEKCETSLLSFETPACQNMNLGTEEVN
jgi:hypothetical protein